MEIKKYTIDLTESEASALEALGFSPYLETQEKVDHSLDMIIPTATDSAQDQAIEPENIDKMVIKDIPDPFVRAQISTKNQMILRNILAALSSIGVVIVFILEKLGMI